MLHRLLRRNAGGLFARRYNSRRIARGRTGSDSQRGGRLVKIWPKRFLPVGPLDPAAFAHNAEKLANEVYGGRMGNDAPGDGFKYRGRGLLQLTGKDSYAEATTILRQSDADAPDFTSSPDTVVDAAWCLQVAASEWSSKGCNEPADQDAINTITKRINGGLIGLAERIEWAKRTKFIYGIT